MSKPCLFCAIASGEAPGFRVFEDDDFAAFLDIRPLFHGHVLLVPKVHVEAVWDLPSPLVGPLGERVQLLSVAVREAIGARGIFNAVNNIVSQSVPHLHVHVVPRNPKDGLRGFFWPRTTYADDAEAEDVAARIRAALPG